MKKCTAIQKLRQPKIFDMAIFDWVATFVGSIIIQKYIIYKQIKKSILQVFIYLIIMGIIIHKTMKVDTMFGYYIGINKKQIPTKCQ